MDAHRETKDFHIHTGEFNLLTYTNKESDPYLLYLFINYDNRLKFNVLKDSRKSISKENLFYSDSLAPLCAKEYRATTLLLRKNRKYMRNAANYVRSDTGKLSEKDYIKLPLLYILIFSGISISVCIA